MNDKQSKIGLSETYFDKPIFKPTSVSVNNTRELEDRALIDRIAVVGQEMLSLNTVVDLQLKEDDSKSLDYNGKIYSTQRMKKPTQNDNNVVGDNNVASGANLDTDYTMVLTKKM